MLSHADLRTAVDYEVLGLASGKCPESCVSFRGLHGMTFLKVFSSERQIVDPAGRSAGFHDHEVDGVLLEDGFQVTPLGRGIKERVFASFGVEKGSTSY